MGGVAVGVMVDVRAVQGEADLEAAYGVRFAVFVDEQKVPKEEELDALDATAFHVVAWEGKAAVGTGRLLEPDDHHSFTRIGRMAVLQSQRGKGVGGAILQALLKEARARGLTEIRLAAQEHAVPFYARHGFEVCSERFDEVGIPHFWMRWAPGLAARQR